MILPRARLSGHDLYHRPSLEVRVRPPTGTRFIFRPQTISPYHYTILQRCNQSCRSKEAANLNYYQLMNDVCFSLHLSPYPAFRLETPTLQATAWSSQFPQSVSCITAIRPRSIPIGFKSAKISMKTEPLHRSTPCVGPPKSRLDDPQTPHHSRK